MIFEQALVDRAQVALGQVTVVDKLAQAGLRAHNAGQLIEGQLELGVTDAVAVEEGVALRVEQPAVKRRHLQRRAAAIDDLKEVAQPSPCAAGVHQQAHPAIDPPGHLAHLA